MAVDKLVDSTQLDADLTSVANAIRAKSGGSNQLAFPSGFVSEIQAIPSGGGGDYVADDWLDKSKPAGDILYTGACGQYDHQSMLTRRTGINNVHFTTAIGVSENLFQASSIKKFVGEKVATAYANSFAGCSSLTAVDVVGLTSRSNTFQNDSALKTIVLRGTSVTAVSSNAFTGTPFKSGGTGGDIYIPKSLYDHLGDGTSNDYKAATNWSVWNGYGTITWHSIEGSIYETQYVDGTPIPTT